MEASRPKTVALVFRVPGWENALSQERLWLNSGVYPRVRDAGFDGKVERVYQLHGKEAWESWINEDLGPRLFIRQKDESVPEAQVFQWERLVERFGEVGSSSIAWMIMDALWEGFDRVLLYGAALAGKVEYAEQRPGVHYLMGFAKAMGKEVSFVDPPDVDLALYRGLYEVKRGPV